MGLWSAGEERSLFRLTVDRISYIICAGVRETSFTPFFVAWWNPGERKGSQILWYFIREGDLVANSDAWSQGDLHVLHISRGCFGVVSAAADQLHWI